MRHRYPMRVRHSVLTNKCIGKELGGVKSLGAVVPCAWGGFSTRS